MPSPTIKLVIVLFGLFDVEFLAKLVFGKDIIILIFKVVLV